VELDAAIRFPDFLVTQYVKFMGLRRMRVNSWSEIQVRGFRSFAEGIEDRHDDAWEGYITSSNLFVGREDS